MSKGFVVTGSEGFIGRHLCYNIPSPIRVDAALGHFLGSSEYEDEFEEIGKDALGIYHLAGHASAAMHEAEPWLAGYDIAATAQVLKTALKYSVPVVVMSSAFALEHNTVYGHVKRSIEQLCNLYLNRGVQVSVARLFNVFGERQEESVTYPSTVTTSLMGRLTVVDDVTLRNPDSQRDFVYVGDVVHALKHLMFQGSQGIYEIGSGELVTVRHYAGLIARLAEFKGNIAYEESHETPPYKRAAFAGWMPQHTPLSEALDKTLSDWKERHG